MSYEEMYLNLYIGLSLGLSLFAVLMVFLSLWKKNPSEARHANILPLLSGIPDDGNKKKSEGLKKEKNDTLSDT